MTFLPKADLLSLEELDRLCSTFVRLGVKKLRITGGEPLVRKGILTFFEAMSRHLETGALQELTLTTNGSQLAKFAAELAACGVRRVNVSLDTLDPAKFAQITRWGRLPRCWTGSRRQGRRPARQDQRRGAEGLQRGRAFSPPDWCAREGHDLTFIEVMPMGEDMAQAGLTSTGRSRTCAPARERYTLTDLAERTGGPARYVRMEETGQKIGFITPLTHNFCESCNRVRLTCTGELYMCLGQEDMADLRAPLRASTRGRRSGTGHPRRDQRTSPRATTSTIPARRWPVRSPAT
jgi:GTP 3',8-cyclase